MKLNIKKVNHSFVTGLIAGLIVLMTIILINGISNLVAILLPSIILALFVTLISYFR